MMRDASEQLRVEEVRVADAYAGHDIASLNLKKCPGTLLLAIRSGGKWLYNPPEKYIIKVGDSLIIMTNPQERQILEGMVCKA
jgi:uncharacterized protein with PhoU and TrkA domain